MSIAPRVSALLLAVASVAVLGGCVGGTPVVSASPSPSATPVFATEEEALAAAEATYQGYIATSDAISSGEESVDLIAEWVTVSYLPTERDGLQLLKDRGISTIGFSSFDSLKIQQAGDLREGSVITAYLCSDISAVRLLDAQGVDVTPADRPNRLPLEVDFEVHKDASSGLLIDRSDVWTGDNFC